MQTYIHLLILLCKILVGNTQTLEPHPVDAGCFKQIQDVERGRKNTTYETLCQLIERLGISPNSLFPSQMSPEDEAIQRFIGKFRACDPANQEILLSTLDFLAEKLLARQHTSESDSSK